MLCKQRAVEGEVVKPAIDVLDVGTQLCCAGHVFLQHRVRPAARRGLGAQGAQARAAVQRERLPARPP